MGITVGTRFLLVFVLAAVSAMLFATSEMAAPTSSPPTVIARSSDYGRILFDGTNHALYAFTRDPREKTTCYRQCAAAWPPYIVGGTLRAGTGTSRSLLGTTRRRDGKRQLTYAGKPLYYYVHDGRGRVLCQNIREFGGLWLVVRPNGRLVR
jgi:predicted lipoprotein with Yx(FWY)xxD motif